MIASVVRFLIVLVVLGAALAGLYRWRVQAQPATVQPAASSIATTVDAASNQIAQNSVRRAGSLPLQSGLPTLAQLDAEFQLLVQKVRPAVVSITAENVQEVYSFFGGRAGALRLPPSLGSGVIVSPDGHIVTNLHVINNARAILVHLADGSTHRARVLGADPLTDIAILDIDAEDLPALPFGNSDEVRPGQIVFAVGNPYGLQETVTQGIISGIGRRSSSEVVNEFFQTDTAINPGNSGGPLLNLRGEIIGINNAILAQNGGWQGISFSIPSNTARRVFEDIRRFGRVVRAWFGVVFGRNLTPALARRLGVPGGQGVIIEYVVPGSPADEAGIQPGDVITSFNNRQVSDGFDLRNRVAETNVGEPVRIGFFRNGKAMETTARLAPLPER